MPSPSSRRALVAVLTCLSAGAALAQAQPVAPLIAVPGLSGQAITQKPIPRSAASLATAVRDRSRALGLPSEAQAASDDFDMQVFISAGMPDGVLSLLFKQAMEYPAGRVRFVLRGFTPQRIGPLLTRLRSLMPERDTDHILIEVDPNAFRTYEVEAVPVYLVREEGAWYEISGAQSLDMAKENVARRAKFVQGELYDIEEPDILALIEERARDYDWQTVMLRAQQRMAQRLQPGFDLPTAAEDSVQYAQPSFTLTSDIAAPDGQGGENVFARAGQTFRLLEHTSLAAPVIVFDPADSRQIEMVQQWLAEPHLADADLFIVGTSLKEITARNTDTLDLARHFGRPVFPWLPQLSERMGVQAVPAIVQQLGDRLQIATVAPKGERR